MLYRRLGNSGLKLSALSYGSWVTFDPETGLDNAMNCLHTAFDGGMNFFDCAEVYAGGAAERILGEAIRELGWPRESYVISTKFYFGLHESVNASHTLNRKYLLHAIDGSLERLGHDTVDLVFCHRPDPETPIEEVVWAMSDMVASGKATYWGTSEWSAKSVRKACEIAKSQRLRAPVMEQPQYSLLARPKVEKDFKELYKSYGLGLTTWSPLASGVLTGKYLNGIPDGSRLAKLNQRRTTSRAQDAALTDAIRALQPIAVQLGCSLAQLAIAWCLKNPNVTSVITGASRASQVKENLGALEIVDLLDEEIMARIDSLFPRDAKFAN